MPAELLPAIFTLDVGSRPILSFEAKNLREAHEICHEQWLRDDLLRLRSDDLPLWDGKVRFRARYASSGEADVYRRVHHLAASPTDEILLAFLVSLDGDGDDRVTDPEAPLPGVA
jgi:hypothetical protein